MVATEPLPGTPVLARGLRWVVAHTERAGEQVRYRLRCTEPALRGFELDLLHPFEGVEPVATEPDPARAGRLTDWRLYHQAFLLEQSLGPGALLAVQPGRIEIAPFQLVPVMRALAMSRPRLLLADGVGLGKTVQAGLVLAELIARRRAHRILIVSPAGPLLAQWHAELRSRFGLRFAVVKDWGTLQEQRRALELGANPFDHLAYCLTSIDFAKQEKVLQDLERSAWDLVVIDEAHHCVRLGGAGDAEDSRRRRLAEVLARQADGLLLLTATPHDGFDAHFASLVELLDPSLVDGRGGLRGEHYRRHVVRRLKSHVTDPKTGEPLFKTRQVHPRPVAFGPDTRPRFAAFQEALLALVAPRLRAAVRQRRYGEVLAFVALLKRSVSTARACRNTLQVVADRYADLARRAVPGRPGGSRSARGAVRRGGRGGGRRVTRARGGRNARPLRRGHPGRAVLRPGRPRPQGDRQLLHPAPVRALPGPGDPGPPGHRAQPATLHAAVADVQALEASVGKDLADLEQKRVAKQRLDAALAPFKRLAAAWSGGVMLGDDADDLAYAALARAVAEGGDPDAVLAAQPKLREMVEAGKEASPSTWCLRRCSGGKAGAEPQVQQDQRGLCTGRHPGETCPPPRYRDADPATRFHWIPASAGMRGAELLRAALRRTRTAPKGSRFPRGTGGMVFTPCWGIRRGMPFSRSRRSSSQRLT